MASSNVLSKDLSPKEMEKYRKKHADIFDKQGKYLKTLAIITVVIALYYVFFFSQFGAPVEMLIKGTKQIWSYFARMFVWREFSEWPFKYYYSQILVTLAIVFGGTISAVIVALPLSFFAARNVMKGRVLSLIAMLLRKLFDVMRGIDMAIWGFIFVRAVGLGPFAGILAIFVQDLGLLSKLFAESHEATDNKPSRGLSASGANTIQKHRFGIFTQSFPTFLALSLYQIESNTRSAAILGFVGAGGIGLVYSEQMRLWNWDVVMFLTLNLVVIVMIMDVVSAKLRRKYIIGEDIPVFEKQKKK